MATLAAAVAVGFASFAYTGAAASAATPRTAAAATTGTTTKYEAENATLSGGAVVQTDHTGYSGTGFVGGYTDSNKGTASTAFTVSAASAGTYALALQYSDGTGTTRTLTLTVDGTVQQISLPATADWNTWTAETTSVNLSAGTHTISYSYGDADNGNVNLDYLDVTETSASGSGGSGGGTGGGGGTTSGSTTKYEAESATLSGGAVVQTDHTGYSGTGFVGGYTDSNMGTASTAFTVSAATAGTYALALQYSDGTGTTRTLTLTVDGTAQQISLPATADWNTWTAETTSVSLSAGTHTISYTFGDNDNGNVNLDYLDVTETSASGSGGSGGGGTGSGGSGPTAPTSVGAQLGYDEYVAAAQSTNGTVIPASTSYPSLASESTTRSAVQLTATGQYVSITLAHAANSIVVRYSIPDNSDGSTATAPLAVYAGGNHVTDLSLTTQYSWLYGGGYTDTHSPSNGPAHHFYDETRALIGEQPAGTVITLQKDAADTAASYTIDLIDTEEVASAASMPSGYTSVTNYGVTPNSGADDTSAINNALADLSGTGTGLWFPAGTYDISDRIGFSNVSIEGAGEWWTTIQSTAVNGNGGLYANGGENHISNLSMFGDQTSRNNNSGAAGIEGEFTSGSTISNVWIEHTKVGIWTDGPTNGLTISGARVRDVFADGIHLNGGTSNVIVENSEVRNAGDDGLAMDTEGGDVTGCTFENDTVANIIQANGIGVYGGGNNTVSDNLVSDTVAFGAGITVSSRFGQAFDGPTTVSGNVFQRTGSYNAQFGIDLGALWVYADQSSITEPVNIENNTFSNSTYQGVLISGSQSVTDLSLTGDTIAGAGGAGIDIEQVGGSMTVSSTSVSGATTGLTNNGSSFTVNRGSGNSGF